MAVEKEKTRLLRAQLRQVRTREQLQAREIRRLRRRAPRVSPRETTGMRAPRGTAVPTPERVAAPEPLYVVRFTLLPHDGKERDYKGVASIALKKPWQSLTEREKKALLHRIGALVRQKEGRNTWLDRVRYSGRLPEWEREEMDRRQSGILISWTG